MTENAEVFGSSKVPECMYRMEFGVPKRLQLDNSIPIPFTVRIVPVHDETSEIIKGLPRDIQIDSIKLSVNATTNLRVPGNINPDDTHYDHHKMDRTEQLTYSSNPKTSIVLSIRQNGSETIDLGRIFEVYLRSDGLQKGRFLSAYQANSPHHLP